VSRFIVPRFFRLVETARSREVFLLTVLGICIGTAWLTSLAGLSLALGAFLGGMVVAGTEHGHRAMAEVLPLRDAFTSVFFVSMGMLFDVRVVAAAPLVVLLVLLAFIIGKALLAILAAMAMRFPGRVAILAGAGLAQFSEFGFVLASLGIESQVVKETEIQPVLAAGIVSMFLTPVLLKLAPHISAGERLLRPLERLLGARSIDDADAEGALAGHVIIVGYGVGGRLLARALRESAIPYVVLELNAETVRKASKEGESIYYADVTSPEALEHAYVKEAKAVVLMINDVQACRRGAAAVRRIAPEVPVVVRTRYLLEGTILAPLATDVVYEEVEAGVEVLARVLRVFDLPRNLIGERIDAARRETQATARPLAVPRRLLGEVTELSDLKIEKVLLRAGAHAIGRTPKELALRRETGALIVALRRGELLIDSPDADQALAEDDVVYLVGQTDAVILACRVLIDGRVTRPPPTTLPATD
jgi:CPA2 family monovalent cation:H+ antiporter-2